MVRIYVLVIFPFFTVAKISIRITEVGRKTSRKSGEFRSIAINSCLIAVIKAKNNVI